MKERKGLILLSNIPSLDRLLRTEPFRVLQKDYGRTHVKRVLQEHLATLRAHAKKGESINPDMVESNNLAQMILKDIDYKNRSKLQSIFNLTGTVLHTNFGRALLPNETINAIVQASSTPITLEFDLKNNKRIERELIIERHLCELTGAESATIVNNNAAAVFLMLKTLANRREIIISRGELVEIGGTFRLSDIMRSSGAKLLEVGTTNCTNENDYKNAIGKSTAMIMKVNCSNYKITGYTKSVKLEKVANIGHSHHLPVCVDLGSGSLLDFSKYGLSKEDTVKETLAAGADLVTFSGDKLLGGPQAGLLVGRTDLILKIRNNSLMRVLRVGKLTLAAIESVLNLYQSPELLASKLTTLRLLTRSQSAIRVIADNIQPLVQKFSGPDYKIQSIPMCSKIGSGAYPIEQLPSYGLVITSNQKGYLARSSIRKLESKLRALPRPVLGRLFKNSLFLDLRCLEISDEASFIEQLAHNI